MAVSYGSSNTSTGTGNLTITKPTGLAEGELLIGFFGGFKQDTGGNNGATYSATGWTELFRTSPSDGSMNCLYKVADSSDVAASDFSFTAADTDTNIAKVGGLLRITASSSFGGAANMQYSNSAVVGDANPSFSGGVTPILTSPLLIIGSAIFMSGTLTTSSYAVTNNNPGSWDERIDITNNIVGSNDASLAIATATYASAGATGAFTMTHSATPYTSLGFLVSINESTNVSTAGTVGSLVLSGNTNTVSADSNVTGSVGSLVINGNAGTVLTPDAVWTNQDKNSSSWTNQNKS